MDYHVLDLSHEKIEIGKNLHCSKSKYLAPFKEAQRKLLFRCYEKTLYFEIFAKQAEYATVRGAGLT